ncbi:serine carboxypeptidase-like 7 [Phalaenopsis equestris]|uniref:serine carboxypeptidase-like 7 n=1 Tax=Phalaenopsis equestris TaxID=78828 RepID=UPI0009E5298D|nr:serine carboxypeptidase-like 7 [Phalaenopsis equestris]
MSTSSPKLPLLLQAALCQVLFFSLLSSSFSASYNITHLPGFDGPLPFRLETGYVTMNEKSGAELFYYFVESERNPSEDPLLLWLLGGPGCSGINGLALDMGPFRFKIDDFDGQLPNLYANPFAWTKISNMIFVDWPIGTGFSYSKTAKDYTTEDVEGTAFIYKFLRKWLLDHPNFLSNPFYMGGDSYGGKITVLTADKIVEGNEVGQKPLINIKGYLVGNAATGEKVDTSSQVPHAYGLGIISKELYKLIMTHCAGEEDFKRPQNVLCATHLETFNGFLAEINSYSILDPDCSDEPPTSAMRSLKENQEEFISSPLSSVPDISCITAALLANYWGNHHLVKEALHVKEGTTERFHRCDFNVNSYYYTRSVPSTVPYHYSFITRGFRALVYSGDHDLKIPILGTLEWVKSLNFFVLEPRRSWHAGGQVAGYTILFSNNLTFATVKGGGHIAPDIMPFECFVMFERWISHQSL